MIERELALCIQGSAKRYANSGFLHYALEDSRSGRNGEIKKRAQRISA